MVDRGHDERDGGVDIGFDDGKWIEMVLDRIQLRGLLLAMRILPTLCLNPLLGVGRFSSFGIATHYGLEGPGMESWRGRDFPHLSRPALGPTQPPIQWVLGIYRGGKAAGAWR